MSEHRRQPLIPLRPFLRRLLFAGTYVLFAGVVFLVGVGVVLAPVLHRAMHRFHLGD